MYLTELLCPCSGVLCMVMENIKNIDSEKQKSSEEIPSLIKFISSNELEGFDSVKGNRNLNNHVPESVSERLSQPAMVSRPFISCDAFKKKNVYYCYRSIIFCRIFDR